jgi:UDP-N-acetylmuramate--alanine ligase
MPKAFEIFGKPAKGQILHFIGVGGIGMSGLAEVLALQGAKVSGSDSGTKGDFGRLEQSGVQVFRSHAADHVPSNAMVVVSTAIRADNPELQQAERLGCVVVHRAEVLAAIMQNYQTIAISGTHGKTSTTALIYSVLAAAEMKVGVINGGVLNALGTNAKLPPKVGDWLVVEADESDASFLKLHPTIAVITNIEPEHMDTYGTEDKLVAAFQQFAESAELAVLCADDPNLQIIASRAEVEIITYGQDELADCVANEFHARKVGDMGGMVMDCTLRGGVLEEVEIALPGTHYVLNSLAALAVAQYLSADLTKALEGLRTFQGVGRRFTKVGTFHGAAVIDDYGHHPTEIATTLDAAKQVYRGRVVAVIQPHRFTRLRDLMEEFAGCAKVADVAVIMPVYSAGEEPLAGITHRALAEKMDALGLPEQVMVVNDEAGLQEALHDLDLGADDAIVCLGAGTITEFAKHLAGHHAH